MKIYWLTWLFLCFYLYLLLSFPLSHTHTHTTYTFSSFLFPNFFCSQSYHMVWNDPNFMIKTLFNLIELITDTLLFSFSFGLFLTRVHNFGFVPQTLECFWRNIFNVYQCTFTCRVHLIKIIFFVQHHWWTFVRKTAKFLLLVFTTIQRSYSPSYIDMIAHYTPTYMPHTYVSFIFQSSCII